MCKQHSLVIAECEQITKEHQFCKFFSSELGWNWRGRRSDACEWQPNASRSLLHTFTPVRVLPPSADATCWFMRQTCCHQLINPPWWAGDGAATRHLSALWISEISDVLSCNGFWGQQILAGDAGDLCVTFTVPLTMTKVLPPLVIPDSTRLWNRAKVPWRRGPPSTWHTAASACLLRLLCPPDECFVNVCSDFNCV